MLQANTCVITIADIAEVITERLQERIILIIDVLRVLIAEVALLHARIGPTLLLRLISHDRVERMRPVPARSDWYGIKYRDRRRQ